MSLYMFCSLRKIPSILRSLVVPSIKSTLMSLRCPKWPQVCRIAVLASRCVGADITITTRSISLPRFGQRSGIGTVWPASYMARAESLRTTTTGDDLVAFVTVIRTVCTAGCFSFDCFELIDVLTEDDEEDVDSVVMRVDRLFTLCGINWPKATLSELEFLAVPVSRMSALRFLCACRPSWYIEWSGIY